MMKRTDLTVTTAGAIVLLSAVLATLVACGKPAGPFEKAGKKVDETVEKVGQQIDKVGDSIQDAAKDAKK